MAVTASQRYLEGLNDAQLEAVRTTEGPLLVVAGAGSGKTRVLTHRVAHLVHDHKVSPSEILAITFTNKAAGEMRERLTRMLGGTARAIWILTFHAACGRILRREAERLGYRSTFTIYDDQDQVRLTKACLEELGKDPKRFSPRGIHHQISQAKNQLVSPAEYRNRVASFWDQTVAETYELYQRRLHGSNAVDFDDLIMLTVEVLERFPEALTRWRKAFRYILVDEYQDTNHAQYRLLQLLGGEHGNVCAVGDPDQSIYAFRGADIRNIMEFERDFPGTRIIPLEQNYRSTNRILRAANAVIEQNRERKPKRLFSDLGEGDPVRVIEVEDEHAEARFVAGEIASLIDGGYSASEIAVFYRTNAQSRVLEDVLVRQDVPYQVIGGPRFYERAEIRDATAYLSVLSNPSDAGSLLRIANRPRRGIGDTSLQRLVAHAEATGRTLFEALADPEAAGLAAASARAVRGFRSMMESLMAVSHELEVDELVERVLERSGTIEALEAERTIEARGRIENLQELVGVAREYRHQAEEPTLAGFLQDISLVSDQDTIRDETGLVTLMTLHNAKGLEFRAVYAIGMEEGIFPHIRSIEEQGIEEERRLCYVGMTRAMERLTLTHTLARSLWGRRTQNLASRFIDELPSDVERERLQPASWSGYRPAGGIEPRTNVPSLSTGDSVRHASLGEGVVTAIEAGGVVTVRFGSDGSERRLMVDYAPLEKIDRELPSQTMRRSAGVLRRGLRHRPVLRSRADRGAHGALLPEPADRADARRARRRADRGRRGSVSVRADRAGRDRADGGSDRGRHVPDASSARSPAGDDARPARRRARARRAARSPLGVGRDDLRSLRLRDVLAHGCDLPSPRAQRVRSPRSRARARCASSTRKRRSSCSHASGTRCAGRSPGCSAAHATGGSSVPSSTREARTAPDRSGSSCSSEAGDRRATRSTGTSRNGAKETSTRSSR